MESRWHETMRKGIYGLTGICWIAIVVIIVVAARQHHLLQLAPIYAYNRPQGLLGWTLASAIVLSITSGLMHREAKRQSR
ncbi:hypothetical protein [Levilactobacillus brevis]|uniref:Uncharacterized protein n=3 Tax=Levilactobacillus brevis TaxID=1580 RepID=U2R6B8_LEVBR|nr:hypothetical protein [Levilactobacillus brevis]ERK46237.1 hypothetical protein HMPREF0495_00006 [Levilactobacillus brevis ATCC 14869 = DSM 20054]MCU0200602.1 hypothetical protein [Levilactobacillus brevis]